jgi:hypothetical protein
MVEWRHTSTILVLGTYYIEESSQNHAPAASPKIYAQIFPVAIS